jgi:hypothetical protein
LPPQVCSGRAAQYYRIPRPRGEARDRPNHTESEEESGVNLQLSVNTYGAENNGLADGVQMHRAGTVSTFAPVHSEIRGKSPGLWATVDTELRELTLSSQAPVVSVRTGLFGAPSVRAESCRQLARAHSAVLVAARPDIRPARRGKVRVLCAPTETSPVRRRAEAYQPLSTGALRLCRATKPVTSRYAEHATPRSQWSPRGGRHHHPHERRRERNQSWRAVGPGRGGFVSTCDR